MKYESMMKSIRKKKKMVSPSEPAKNSRKVPGET
jgi:hypothetical protein